MREISKRLIRTVILLTAFIPLQANAETLSLNTFYPSPYGTYTRMRLVPQAADPACAGLDGLLWVNSAGDLRLCWGGLGGAPTTVWKQDDVTDMVYVTDLGSGANPALKVGMGTGNAQTILHITDTVAPVLRLDSSSGAGVGMEIYEGVTRRATITSNAIDALSVADSAGTQRFVVTQAGNVGIGVPVPLGGIHLTNNIHAQGNFYSGAIDTAIGQLGAFGNGAGSSQGGRVVLELAADHDTTFQSWVMEASSDDFQIYRNNPPMLGMQSLYLESSGNASINGPPIGTNKLTVRGDLYVNNDLSSHVFYYISDGQFKENIHELNGWDIIKQLNGVEFDWNDSGKHSVGIIAQDVEKVLPELISVDASTGNKSVQYGNLVAPLIEAVKEQQAQIESLREQVNELKDKQF